MQIILQHKCRHFLSKKKNIGVASLLSNLKVHLIFLLLLSEMTQVCVFLFYFAERVIVLKSKEQNKALERKVPKETTRGRRTKGKKRKEPKK